jgi:hypothetical protein
LDAARLAFAADETHQRSFLSRLALVHKVPPRGGSLAGILLWVKRDGSGQFYLPFDVRFTLIATEIARRCNMSRWAK